MGKILFLLFVAVPFVEVYLLIKFGQHFGFLATVAMVIITGFVGAWLAKREGGRVFRDYQRSIAEGRMPERGVLDGVLVLVGAVLLMAPGIITDLVGLLLLFPPTRLIAAKLARRWARSRIQVVSFGQFGPDNDVPHEPPSRSRGRIIDIDPVPPKR